MTTKDRKWRKGPPPHVGWWNASVRRFKHAWRWWDGEQWSYAASTDMRASQAGMLAMFKQQTPGVEYRTYYPENARVPRIDPRAAS